MKKTLIPLELGPLPIEKINRALSLELKPGNVILPIANQQHAMKRHPKEYPYCFPYVGAAIQNPMYIGDDHRNHGKIELIGGLPGIKNRMLLVAINIEITDEGVYKVSSFYPVSRNKIDNRVRKKFLVNTYTINKKGP
ncbi:MAG: hypothetical protein OQJ97_17525 [Rhodospirillales bacterium]|nr:hypothetical protein [Rhodospirillales bacterium]